VLERKMTWALGSAAVATAALFGVGLIASTPAAAGLCAAKCLIEYNGCRIRKKGAPQCDAAYTDCLQRCRKKH